MGNMSCLACHVVRTWLEVCVRAPCCLDGIMSIALIIGLVPAASCEQGRLELGGTRLKLQCVWQSTHPDWLAVLTLFVAKMPRAQHCLTLGVGPGVYRETHVALVGVLQRTDLTRVKGLCDCLEVSGGPEAEALVNFMGLRYILSCGS